MRMPNSAFGGGGCERQTGTNGYGGPTTLLVCCYATSRNKGLGSSQKKASLSLLVLVMLTALLGVHGLGGAGPVLEDLSVTKTDGYRNGHSRRGLHSINNGEDNSSRPRASPSSPSSLSTPTLSFGSLYSELFSSPMSAPPSLTPQSSPLISSSSPFWSVPPPSFTPCLDIEDPSLLTECKTVHLYTLGSVAGPAEKCHAFVKKIVFAADGLVFYFLLDQACFSPTLVIVKRLQSIMKGDLTLVRQGLQTHASTSLISNWWLASVPDGPPPSTPLIYNEGVMPSPAFITGVDLSKNGTHLLLTTYTENKEQGETSWIVYVNIANGARRSIPFAACVAQSLAFNPNKTELYFADQCKPPQILTMDVPDPDTTNTSGLLSPTPLVTFDAPTEVNITSPAFGAYSLSRDGKCLYFVDDLARRVWHFDLLSKNVRFMAGEANSGSASGTGLELTGNITFDVATTSDGCNVFVSSGRLCHWITLDSPCGTPLTVKSIAFFDGGRVVGIAISENDDYLYLGSNQGALFEFAINKSNLQACRTSTLPSNSLSPSSLPLDSPLPSSSLPSPSYSPSSSLPSPPLSSSGMPDASGSTSTRGLEKGTVATTQKENTIPHDDRAKGSSARSSLYWTIPVSFVSVLVIASGVGFILQSVKRRRRQGEENPVKVKKTSVSSSRQ